MYDDSQIQVLLIWLFRISIGMMNCFFLNAWYHFDSNTVAEVSNVAL